VLSVNTTLDALLQDGFTGAVGLDAIIAAATGGGSGLAIFPESSPAPDYPLILRARYMTSSAGLGNDGIVSRRRAAVAYPAYDVSVAYDSITAVDAQTLWNFYKARAGRLQAFYIYDLSLLAGTGPAHVGEYVGKGDGAEDTYDLPGRSTSSQTIYVDGVAQYLTVDYTISYGTGDAAADQVVFAAPPTAGSMVTADFTGYLRCRVVFARDTLDRELFMRDLMRYRRMDFDGVAPLA